MWKVPLFKLNFDDDERLAVNEVIDSGWLTMGEKTKKFESQFADYLGDGVKCIAVANGTAAIHMALLAIDIGPGDEVIIPSLTFVADINTVLLTGATPILADCTSYDDWNIVPIDIEKKITDRTKAVLIVHYAGYPCDMDAIKKICNLKDLILIEDAAHAPGSRYKGLSCGTISDIGCFSFFSNKNLSMGEGGLLATHSEKLYQKLCYLRSHGMTTLTLDRHEGRALSYDVIQPGLNYRIDELRAAIGLVQLSKLDHANKQRETLVLAYIEKLKYIKEVSVPFLQYIENEDYLSSYHIFPILLNKNIDRMSVIESLKQEGIQSSIHYPAIQNFSAYRNLDLGSTPIANDISDRELTLPLYPTMSENELNLVVSSLKKALKS